MDGVLIPRFKADTFVWITAPTVAGTVIEELRQASQKWNQLAHVLGVQIILWSE